jgi:hypothetical protein
MDTKHIGIIGTNNRYKMKKVLKEPTIIKQREVSQSWSFSYNDQLMLVNNLDETNSDDASKSMFSEFKKKISGYKQQDKKKGIYEQQMFIDLVDVIDKLRECELQCHYCSQKMLVLYDMSRESRQWTVDRIDNDKGHNMGNYHLACLECNLKRRRTNHEKFLMSKSTFSRSL